VEDTIWENKDRKYIANYGIPFDLQLTLVEGEEFFDYTYGV
jgi:hypothetical protein